LSVFFRRNTSIITVSHWTFTVSPLYLQNYNTVRSAQLGLSATAETCLAHPVVTEPVDELYGVYRPEALADLDGKVRGAKLGRDAEGAENRDAHCNMATRGLGILGAAWPLHLNPQVARGITLN